MFKVVTYSAALEEGIEHPDDLIDCQGGMIVVNGLRIHDLHKMGTVSIAEALAKSSDVAAVKVGLKLGDERLYKYIRAYGFGSQTGIELPGETRGLAKPVNKWSKVSIGAMSIGQEVGVTPLQLVSMVSTIANDGVYLPPRILAGTDEAIEWSADDCVSSGEWPSRGLDDDCGADEEDDGRRGAVWDGEARDSGWIQFRGQDRNGAEN